MVAPRRILFIAPIALLGAAAAAAVPSGASTAAPAFQHGVSFFGEFKYPPNFEHFDYVNPDAPKGGTLVLATHVSWNSFTPYLYRGDVPPGISHQFGSNPLFYDGLFTASDDELGTFYGNLAKEVSVAEDFTRVRVRLRPEARWHDGVPVTARDVRFTFAHIRDNSGFNLRSAFGMVESVEVHGDREFTFHLLGINGVNAAVVTSLGKLAILPEHYWRERDITQTTLTPPLGSGPYRIAAFTQSRSLVYERVPDYWGKDLAVHRGRHNFDRIRYDYYRDPTVAREAFRKGHIDYWRETDPGFWHHGFDVPALADGRMVKHHQNFQYYMGLLRGLVLNSRREHLRDVRVREALTLLFHYDFYDRVINWNFYRRPQSYFAPSGLSAAGLPSPAETALLAPFRDQVPARVFSHAFELPRASAPGRNRATLRRGMALLREAGWRLRRGVLANAAGERFQLSFVIQTAAELRAITQYVDQLRSLGFEVRIRRVEPAHFVNLMKDFEFDIAFGQLGVAQPPGVEIVSYWHSSNATLPQTRNLSGIANEAVDELIMRVLNARSREDLTASARALDRVLLWNFLTIPLVAVEGPRALYWNRLARPPFDAEFRTSFPAAWWFDDETAAGLSAPD